VAKGVKRGSLRSSSHMQALMKRLQANPSCAVSS
jgi:hypothetical protein